MPLLSGLFTTVWDVVLIRILLVMTATETLGTDGRQAKAPLEGSWVVLQVRLQDVTRKIAIMGLSSLLL